MTGNVHMYNFSLIACIFFLGIAATPISAHEWMAPKEAANQKNSVSATVESVKHGKELFLNHCAYCHSDTATGMSADEVGLEKSPPNLIQRLKNHTDGDFFWKIQHGRSEMPGFKNTLEDDEIWHIINFIKSR